MLLNLAITVAEVIGGIYSGSLSLLSDALHNLSDMLSIVVSYFAIFIKAVRYLFTLLPKCVK
jgi:cobalt-zinc-cadmium efflux system protein